MQDAPSFSGQYVIRGAFAVKLTEKERTIMAALWLANGGWITRTALYTGGWAGRIDECASGKVILYKLRAKLKLLDLLIQSDKARVAHDLSDTSRYRLVDLKVPQRERIMKEEEKAA